MSRNLFKGRMLAQGILLVISIPVSAQLYNPIDSVGSVRFTIKNFGLTVAGTLQGLRGEIFIDESDSEKSYFHVQVDAQTIDTGINLRNKHLKQADYFDTEKFPTILFRSTKIVSATDWSQVTGLLTIKGITKPVTISFTTTGTQTKTFIGSFTINRQHFKVGGNSATMADEVRIELTVRAHPVK
ncbi:MAG: YceI family protein [Cyclobacteriaceae bacterium]|nr:YceI family protein [Cyclobacteriaceae bacterium]MBX2915120.1 YceI family protein [Cyclobacteriaceae bacterium]